MTMKALDDFSDQETPTPWFEMPVQGGLTLPEPDPSACKVVFFHEFSDPIVLTETSGCTIHDFVQAHAKLVGNLQVTSIFNQHGVELSPTTALVLGQVICIRCEDCPESLHDNGLQEACDVPVDSKQPVQNHVQGPYVVSPTVEWSQPVCESKLEPLQETSPSVHNAEATHQASWVSAAPLLSLDADQLMRLKVPAVINDHHLWSLRTQVFTKADRSEILDHQAGMWSDDEIRHHIAQVIHAFE